MDLASRVVRHRRWIVIAWLVLIPLALAAAWSLHDRMAPATRLEGSESAAVEDLLADRFAAPTAQSVLLVARGLVIANPEAESALLQGLAAALREVPGVRTVASPATSPDTLLRGQEPGSAIFLVGIDTRQTRGDSIVMGLRRATETAVGQLRAAAPELSLHWTGTAALMLDLRRTSSSEARRAELRALPVLLAVLLLAFRSVVAAVIPLVLGGLAIGVGLGVALMIGFFGTPSLLLGNVASILGLALGVDYSLLTVTRFREALSNGASPEEASVYAVRNAGHTILLSGSTVALGFAGLLLVPIAEIRSVGLGGLGVAAVAVALATTLLPAILVQLGARIDRGRLGPRPSAVPNPFWYRLGWAVTAHPVRVLLLAGTPLILLSIPALRLSTAAPQEDWLPETMESARGLTDLAQIGRAGLAYTIPVVVDLSRLDGATDSDRWRAVAQMGESLSRDPRIGEVRSAASLAAIFGVPAGFFLGRAPDPVRAHFLSQDGTLARLDVVPALNVPNTELAALVRTIRALGAEGGTAAYLAPLVGGVPAFQADYERAVQRAFPWAAVSVIGSILLALSFGFRSVLIPLKATVLNLLTVGAGFGALVLVFQYGYGSRLIGLGDPISGVFPAVPILAFCIIFGLSMDYEVFLVGRIAEARRTHPHRTEREAIVEGLARTGRVITFAAVLMVIVFAAFAFGDYLPAKLLGFGLAAAVLADVTLVRLAVGPALLQLAGRWNWWPSSAYRPPPE